MRIGIPKEVKTLEARVGLIAPACSALVAQGHEVFLEMGAGLASGYPDTDYIRQGVQIVPDAQSLYMISELIVKVKEPQPQEWPLLRAEQRLFCYLHLAAEPDLSRALCDIGLTAVAFETISAQDGSLPLLLPMSQIAGKLAVHHGSYYLQAQNGGKGCLLGGLAGTQRSRVVVLGAGAAGQAASSLAAAMGADVVVFDKRQERLQQTRDIAPNITTLYAYPDTLTQQIQQADLVIGAVLVTGARAPQLLTREMLSVMEAGSVLVDISVDQGGCFETTRPTTYADPVYQEQGITHFAVTNMPGAVPKTASQALSAAILPSLLQLTQDDWQQNPMLKTGINIHAGQCVHPALLSLT